MDRQFKADQPKKAVFLYPIVDDASTQLQTR
jgi:hypothetical protein